MPLMSASDLRGLTGLTRNEIVFDKAKLLEIYDKTIDEKPM